MYLIFDLDDTLLDTTATAGRFQLHRVATLWLDAGCLKGSLNEIYESLVLLRREYPSARQMLESYASTHGITQDWLDAAVALYYGTQDDAPIAMRPGALTLLQTLAPQARLALVSVGNAQIQQNKMERAGLPAKFFEALYFVPEGAKGPAYASLLSGWGLAPCTPHQKVWAVVGDRYLRDLAPATDLGGRTVLVGRGSQEGVPDYCIQELLDLLPLVELWRREEAWGAQTSLHPE